MHHLNKARQKDLRKPTELLLEKDVAKFREYLISHIEKITEDPFLLWDEHSFVELRDVCGCEPARLLLEEWDDAHKDKWNNKQRAEFLDHVEKSLIKQIKITYQCGKGKFIQIPHYQNYVFYGYEVHNNPSKQI